MPDSPQAHVNTRVATALFRATTLGSFDKDAASHLVHRKRILDFINRHPNTGAFTCIIGPIGAGKTTVAMQWAQEYDGEIQYVSASEYSSVYASGRSEPSPFGLALARLFDACGHAVQDPSAEEIRGLLEKVLELSHQTRESFILDDMEHLSRHAMMILQPMLLDALPRLHVDRALIVSRTMDSLVMNGLQTVGALRMVLPSTLEFDQQETEEAVRLGVFGTASIEQVKVAREESSGWLTGMLTSLWGTGGQTMSTATLHSLLLNEMLLKQPTPILNAMMASAIVPSNSPELWERWFDHLEIRHLFIPPTLTQLPTRLIDGQTTRFEIVPVMRDALVALRSLTADKDILEDLIRIAVHWYVERGELESAVRLATEQGAEHHLLSALKPICTAFAQSEDWTSILETIGCVPDEVLAQDNDITYWVLHGRAAHGRPADLNRLSDMVMDKWKESEDPLVRGRFHLISSFGAYMRNQADESRREAETAFHTLPKNAYRELHSAAATASIAESYLADSPRSHRWAALANNLLPYLPTSLRWWHNNAGPARLSYLATSGRMQEAYDLATKQIEKLLGDHPTEVTRYYIIKAQIDIERLRFDSAESLIDIAQTHAIDRYAQKHHLRMVESELARAQGNPEDAWDAMDIELVSPSGREDLGFREAVTLARIALEMGDTSVAEFVLQSTMIPHDLWPKYFGDPHHDLMVALIRSQQGDHEEAISLAVSVADEGLLRGHIYFVVNAYATAAHIYLSKGDTEQADGMLWRAIKAQGNAGYQLAYNVLGQDVRKLRPVISVVETSDRAQILTEQDARNRLTNRELQALELAAQPLTNKEIAERMYISVSTVKNHLARAYDKLGAHNRRGAVRIARNIGLLDK